MVAASQAANASAQGGGVTAPVTISGTAQGQQTNATPARSPGRVEQNSTAALNAQGLMDNPTRAIAIAAGQTPGGRWWRAAVPRAVQPGIPAGHRLARSACRPGGTERRERLYRAADSRPEEQRDGSADTTRTTRQLQSGRCLSTADGVGQFPGSAGNDPPVQPDPVCTVADTYGQNFGVGQPGPANTPTLAAGQATGALGYIPGFTGTDASQTQSNIAGQATTAQGAAGLTGFYAAPSQSQFTPGSFVRLDPGSYDSSTYGTQISYVLPSGQLQRVNIPQAQAMGWNGNLSTMPTISAQQAIGLESAPPSQLPVQTIAGLTGYSNLNTAAQNSAVAQAGVTGMYQAPATVQPPGTNWGGQTFSSLPQQVQQNYYQSRGGDWNAAMQAWVNDSNNALIAAGGSAPAAGTPQETLAAQNQYFTQANDLATQYGQYYAPSAPGQTGVAGTNMPQAGQTTLAGQQQAYSQQMGVINAAAALQANPFRQAQVIGQAGRVLQGLPTAGFSAPNTVTGVGTAGGNTQGGMGYMSQLIQDIQDPTANQTTAQSWLDNTPTPNKLDSTSFMASSPTTQNLILQSMQEKYGLDPTDSMAQIKNTLPQFNAPNTLGQVGNR